MLTCIVGINWGDEGKGRMVDLLSRDEDIVCRYQGGINAGHTVVNARGRFVLNLLPSGILRPDVVCVLGGGMCISPEYLEREIAGLGESGVSVSPANLKISDRAVVITPCDLQLDGLEKAREGVDLTGLPLRGTAIAYAGKVCRQSVRMGDLLDRDYLHARLTEYYAYKSPEAEKMYGQPLISLEELLAWADRYADLFAPYVCDVTLYLSRAAADEKHIMFEGQLGALRDVDFGIYPYVSSYNTIAAYAPIGAGIPGMKVDRTIGIMKAYSTSMGDGPFVSELFGAEADMLREVGHEFSSVSGFPRRVGAFDAVASRYGVRLQGADEIALTKLDTISYMDKIPVCVAYEIDGQRVEDFPVGPALLRAKPIYEYVDGWNCDISDCRRAVDLPVQALIYVKYLEELVGCRITYVSVGDEREAYIKW